MSAMHELRNIRTRRGLSLKALAEMSDSDASALARYEKGQRRAPADTACLVARALGVPVEFLVMGWTYEDSAMRKCACVLHGSEIDNGPTLSISTARDRDEREAA